MLIDRVIAQEEYFNSHSIPCSSFPTLSNSSLVMLEQAQSHLTSAIANRSRAAHPYLLLGRVFCYRDQPEAALVNYQEYINLRPDNPLGHLELGFVWEALGEQDNAGEEWERSHVSPQDFIKAGEKALSEGRLQNPLRGINVLYG